MAIDNGTARTQVTLTSTNQALAAGFPVILAADMLVLKTNPTTLADTTLILNTNYTVQNAGTETNAIVTMIGGTVGDIITMARNAVLDQPLNLTPLGGFPSISIERALDRFAEYAQQVNLKAERALRVPFSDSPPTGVELNKASRKSKLLGFDASGNVQLYTPEGAIFVTGQDIEVPDVTTLRSLNPALAASGKRIIMTGYYSHGDFGQPRFGRWNASSTATDDSGTVFQITGVTTGRFEFPISANVNVKWFGAKGDGTTNDTPAILKATEFAYADGGGVVEFPTATYAVNRRTVGSQIPAILLRAGVSVDGLGSTILLKENCAFMGSPGGEFGFATTATITANVALGDTQFTVDTTANLTAGDVVGIRLGDNADDAVETKRFYFSKVRTVDSATLVTVDTPAPEAMTAGSTAAGNRKLTRFRASDNGGNAVYENCFIRNIRLVQGSGGNAESGLDLRFTRNIRVENIYSENPGSGVILSAYSFNFSSDNVYVSESIAQSGQASKGRVINLVNVENASFRNIRAKQYQGQAVFVESYCRNVTFENVEFVENWVAATGTAKIAGVSVWGVAQNSYVHVHGFKLRGTGTDLVVIDYGGTTAKLTYSDWDIDTAQNVKSLFVGEAWSGGYLNLRGSRLSFDQLKRVTIPIRYDSGFSDHNPVAKLPAGVWLGAWYYANKTTGLTAVQQFLLRNSGNSISVTVNVANTRTSLGVNVSNWGSDYPFNTGTEARDFRLYSGTVDRDTVVYWEVLFCPISTEDGTFASTLNSIHLAKARTLLATLSMENTLAGGGIYLHSPDGTRYKITVPNGGASLTITAEP